MTETSAYEAFDTGSITARGPITGVTVHAHMRSGPHALTEHPLDLTLAVELMFLFAEQARRSPDEAPLKVTPQSVLERLQAAGVRSGNGSRLVGRDAVYESFARLRAKGYIRRIVESDPATGQRTGVAYEFYDWPAWNPDAPAIGESLQVTPTSGIAGSGDAGSRPGKRTKNGSAQVGATSGIAGSGDAGNSGFPQVGSTSGNAGSPPHPPEEEDSSSPYPLTRTSSAVQQQDDQFTAEELAAAAAFLQQMKRWQAGAATARRCAPRLLRTLRKQGWPSLAELGEEQTALLETEILKNTGGAKSWTKCLPGWVEDLRLYDRVRARAAAQGADGRERCPDHPGRYRVGCIDCAMAVPS